LLASCEREGAEDKAFDELATTDDDDEEEEEEEEDG
jgi:hypothetical protein